MTREKIAGLAGIGEDLLLPGLRSLAGVAEAADAIAEEASACTRKVVAAASLERLVTVRSFAEAVEVQSEAARQGYEAMVAGATRLSQLYAELGRQACMPFEKVIVKAG